MSDLPLTMDAVDIVYDPQHQLLTTYDNVQYAMDDAFNAITGLQSYLEDIKSQLEQI